MPSSSAFAGTIAWELAEVQAHHGRQLEEQGALLGTVVIYCDSCISTTAATTSAISSTSNTIFQTL